MVVGGVVTGTDGARGDHLSRKANFNRALLGSESDTVMCVVLCVQPLMMWII